MVASVRTAESPRKMRTFGSAKDMVSQVVWSVGNIFGFQAFNQVSGQEGGSQITSATLFLVSQNLSSLLLQDLMPRASWQHSNGSPTSAPLSNSQAFAIAVFNLHSTLMQPYRQWCDHVDLHHRTTTATDLLTSGTWDSPLSVNHLLHELALWFLLWTEASSLRHMPEALWFVFWMVQHHHALRTCTANNLPLTQQLMAPVSTADVKGSLLSEEPHNAASRLMATELAGTQQYFSEAEQASDACPATGGSGYLKTAMHVRRQLHKAGVLLEAAGVSRMPWHGLAARSGTPEVEDPAQPCSCWLCASTPPNASIHALCRLLGPQSRDTKQACLERVAVQLQAKMDSECTEECHHVQVNQNSRNGQSTTQGTGLSMESVWLTDSTGPLPGTADGECTEILLGVLQGGDGGRFLENVIEPFFRLAAREVSQKFQNGVPVHHRLGYDDINESFCAADRVHAMLRYLHKNGRGTSTSVQEPSEGAAESFALDGLVRLTSTSTTHTEFAVPDVKPPSNTPKPFLKTSATIPVPGTRTSTSNHSSKPEDSKASHEARGPTAPEVWSQAAVKTFSERRGWAMFTRNYSSMVTLHGVMLYLQVAISQWGICSSVLASTALVHAACLAITRCCNVWCSDGDAPDTEGSPASPLYGPIANASSSVVVTSSASMPVGAGRHSFDVSLPSRVSMSPSALTATSLARSLRHTMSLRSAAVLSAKPLSKQLHLARSTFKHALFVFATFSALSVLSLVLPAFHILWCCCSALYGAVWLGYITMLTRAGHMVSVLESLPVWLGGAGHSGARVGWLYSNMQLSRASFRYSLISWAAIITIKSLGDYHLLVSPMVVSLQGLAEAHCHLVWDAGVVSGVWERVLLVSVGAARVAPVVVMCAADTFVWALLVHIVMKLFQDVCTNNLVAANCWSSAMSHFDIAIPAFWNKCLAPTLISPTNVQPQGPSHDAADGICSALTDREISMCIGADFTGVATNLCSSVSMQSHNTMSAPFGASLSNGDASNTTLEHVSESPPPAPVSRTGSCLHGTEAHAVSPATGSEELPLRSLSEPSIASTATQAHRWPRLSLAQVMDRTVQFSSLLSVDMRSNLLEHELLGGCENIPPLASLCSTRVSEALDLVSPSVTSTATLDCSDTSTCVGPAHQDPPVAAFRRTWHAVVADMHNRDLLSIQEAGLLHFSTAVLPFLHSKRNSIVWQTVHMPPPLQYAGKCAEAACQGSNRTHLVSEHMIAVTSAARVLCGLGLNLCIITPAQAVQLLLTSAQHAVHSAHALNQIRTATPRLLAAITRLRLDPSTSKATIAAVVPCVLSAIDSALNCCRTESGKASAVVSVTDAQLEAVLLNYSATCVIAPDRPTTAETLLQLLDKLVNLTPSKCTPALPEASNALAFFVSSLQNPELDTTAPVQVVPSHSVLTPLYGEDILYAMDAQSACKQVGCPPAKASGISDLVTLNDSTTCTLDYLRSIHSQEWSHFADRIALKHPDINAADIRNAPSDAFRCGGALDAISNDVVLWASCRGQLLARTVRGIMMYEKALMLAAKLEGCKREDVSGKFQYIVACQKYGEQKVSSVSRERWHAHCVDQLMQRNPSLQVAYIDSQKQFGGTTRQASVLLATVEMQEQETGTMDTKAYDAAPKEVFRVRLPVNTFTQTGIILGEGKGENQNHAIIFTRGECIQVIDMNQDNVLSEAMKMRNLLSGFSKQASYSCTQATLASLSTSISPTLSHPLSPAKDKPVSSINLSPVSDKSPHLDANPDPSYSTQPPTSPRATPSAESVPAGTSRERISELGVLTLQEAIPNLLALHHRHLHLRVPNRKTIDPPPHVPCSATVLLDEIAKLKSEKQEMYMTGLGETIFSAVAGSMADMSATMELSFQSMYSVYSATGAKAHYGHPDVMNKLFVITRGGLSKATKEIHVSEDVFGSFNHMLRGGLMAHATYMTVQKGRDLAIESINLFETKITRGQVQVWCSRDAFRLMQLLDPFRQLHFVYAYRHAGHFFGAWAVFHALSAYAFAFALTSAAAALRVAACTGIDTGTCATAAAWGQGPGPLGVLLPLLILAQLTLPMLLPHIANVLIQDGVRRACSALVQHIASGWLMFSLVMERSKAWHIGDSMRHGGTSYLPTGRQFGICHYPLTHIIITFARSHMGYGIHIGTLLACGFSLLYCTEQLHVWLSVSVLTGILVSAALVWAPIVFNPYSLDYSTVQRDTRQVWAWLNNTASGAKASESWSVHHDAESARQAAESASLLTYCCDYAALVAPALLALVSGCVLTHSHVSMSGLTVLVASVAAAIVLLLDAICGSAGHKSAVVYRYFRWGRDTCLSLVLLGVSLLLSSCTNLHSTQISMLFRISKPLPAPGSAKEHVA